MKTKAFRICLPTMVIVSLLGGCSKSPEIASPSCAQLEKATDPAIRAELMKKCPRGGSGFKPSPKVVW